MKRSPITARRGIALVITLIMLSVVTITAVAFLALSRRERGAVSAAGEQLDAQFFADAALNRAKAAAAARLISSGHRGSLDLFVSTNYLNPSAQPGLSFINTGNFDHLTNVSYYKNPLTQQLYNLGLAGDRALYEEMLANLFYNPRVPVFVSTNRDPRATPEFRYYLDLNRNGRFETNGLVSPTDRYGRTNGVPQPMVGDPEWVGVLQNPDLPYSGTNLFVGRIAYLVAPASRTLDINTIHNAAKTIHGSPDANGYSAYFRNQGVGSWEINLAAFLADLNTNIWGIGYSPTYRFNTNLSSSSTGLAFGDAAEVLEARRNSRALADAQSFFRRVSGNPGDTTVAARFKVDGVDMYSDGPLVTAPSQIVNGVGHDNDSATLPWIGSDFTNSFTDINQLFSSSLTLAPKLSGVWPTNNPRTSPRSTYDNYTFYRMLAQLGTDTGDARFETGLHPAYGNSRNPSGFYRRAKLNLQYAMDNPNGSQSTNAEVMSYNGLRDWTPIQWFTNAAQRLLLAQYFERPDFTNGLPFAVPDQPGYTPRIAPGVAIAGRELMTNFVNGNPNRPFQFWTNHAYSAEIHRPLQLAANIFDYQTNRSINGAGYPFMPSIFRPLIYRDNGSPNVLRLAGYEEVTSTNFGNSIWYSPDDPRLDTVIPTTFTSRGNLPVPGTTARDVGVYGVPWVVGAKKGLPGFNEGFWQSAMQVTRRLIFTKPTPQSHMNSSSESPFPGGNGEGFQAYAQYLITFTNTIGMDAWNSYTNPYPRPVRIYANNVHQFYLRTGNPTNGPVLYSAAFTNNNPPVHLAAGSWRASEYVAALNTNLSYSFLYDPYQNRLYPSLASNTVLTHVSVPLPQLSVAITNSLLFTIADEGTGRFIDFVTLQSKIIETNLFAYLGASNVGANLRYPPVANQQLDMPAFWYSNSIPIYGNLGIENQYLASLGRVGVLPNLWLDANGQPAQVGDVGKSTNGLNYFLFHTLTGTAAQQQQIKLAYEKVTAVQAGFNPSPVVVLTDRRMINDPMVHYTMDDLQPGYSVYSTSGNFSQFTLIDGTRYSPGGNGGNGGNLQFSAKILTNQIGLQKRIVSAYAPWGVVADVGYQAVAPAANPNSPAYDMAYKDPLIVNSDAWRFPTNSAESTKFANIGELGRVHRGTPWQTVYLKATPATVGNPRDRVSNAKSWMAWYGSVWNQPTNDWRLMDLFTTAINDNAARGLLGVNQTNVAAWSAVLSEVSVFDNRLGGVANANPATTPQLYFLSPNSPEVTDIVLGYTNYLGAAVPGIAGMLTNQWIAPKGRFDSLGMVLSAPTLSSQAPFLSIPPSTAQAVWRSNSTLTDELIERLPQQILSLLRSEEPRVVVYSFGQTLKPAANSLVTRPGRFYGISTNYQITGEYATKTVLRFDGPVGNLVPVVEDHRVLYPSN